MQNKKDIFVSYIVKNKAELVAAGIYDNLAELKALCDESQIDAYALALSRIYQLPVKEKYLYLFHLDQFISV